MNFIVTSKDQSLHINLLDYSNLELFILNLLFFKKDYRMLKIFSIFLKNII
jgi:hypothetical protein